LYTVGLDSCSAGAACNIPLQCISSGSISLSAPAGSKPDRSKILPNVTSAYCEKLYTQARSVFSFHLRLYTCGRTASRRSRYAATLPGQPAFGSPNGAYPRTSGAGSTTARSRSKHRSAGRSRVAPGLTLTGSEDFIEIHHLVPISEFQGWMVSSHLERDYAALCSNCHSMKVVHDIEALRARLQ